MTNARIIHPKITCIYRVQCQKKSELEDKLKKCETKYWKIAKKAIMVDQLTN
jgi:hypothetical protein